MCLCITSILSPLNSVGFAENLMGDIFTYFGLLMKFIVSVFNILVSDWMIYQLCFVYIFYIHIMTLLVLLAIILLLK